MALTKADMAESLFNEVGLNKHEAHELVDLFFEELEASLADGEQIRLSGFGNFDLRDKNERPGRNPKTGEEVSIPARRVVTFKAGQKLRARVEGYAGTGEKRRTASCLIAGRLSRMTVPGEQKGKDWNGQVHS